MFTFLLVIHIIISLLLVIVILLQSGKGGGLASAFGGSGTTEAVFGGRQAATFLSKATSVLGTLFFLMVFALALLSSYQSGPRSAVQEQLQNSATPLAPTQVGQPEQALPQGAPAPQSGGTAQPSQP